MKLFTVGNIACLAALVGLAGCSTPPEVVASAGHTAMTQMQLGQELARFSTARKVSDASILEVSKPLQVEVETQRKQLGENLRAHEAAGDFATVQLFDRLKKLSNDLRKDEEEFEKLLAQIDAETATLLKPLPDSSSQLSAAAGATMLIGQDLSTKTQFDETVNALQTVWKNTKDNRDKFKKATE